MCAGHTPTPPIHTTPRHVHLTKTTTCPHDMHTPRRAQIITCQHGKHTPPAHTTVLRHIRNCTKCACKSCYPHTTTHPRAPMGMALKVCNLWAHTYPSQSIITRSHATVHCVRIGTIDRARGGCGAFGGRGRGGGEVDVQQLVPSPLRTNTWLAVGDAD